MPQSTPPSTAQPIGPPTASPHVSLRSIYIVVSLIAGVLLGVGGLYGYQEFLKTVNVTTYEECINAKGSRIQESYPQTCITRGGKRFIQPIIGDDDGINPIYKDPNSCTTDSDCVVGIQAQGCCICPQPINSTEIGNDGWEMYVPGKDYSKRTTCESFIACEPCPSISLPRCRDNLCTSDASPSATPHVPAYTCPQGEWVDCMPGPLEGKTTGIRLQCTEAYLTWAKENCPGFKGAAL